jgi:hypothetical protein
VAFGLGIHSEVPLPEVEAGSIAPDISVRVANINLPLPTELEGNCYIRASKDDVHLYWPGHGSVLVSGGREITLDPDPSADASSMRLIILGPAIGVLLHQRGYLVLHASVVNVDGGAVAFLGDAGWGKSTIAAALYARGHTLVADDIAAVRFENSEAHVYPGFPQLKLWPQTITALGEDPDSLPRVEQQFEKRARTASHNFSQATLPLKRIYVLDQGDRLHLAPLGPGESIMELVRHTYVIRLLKGTGTLESHLRQCAELAGRVPVLRLSRPVATTEISDVADMVERDCQGLMS